jgi:hypothetical protein
LHGAGIGPAKISMYLKRYDDMEISQQTCPLTL